MIETDPHDRTPARTQDDTRAVIHTAADPAAVLHGLIQRRQALLHQESADLNSLRSYAERLAHRLPPQPARTPLPPAGVETVAGTEAADARLDTMLDAAETEVLILDRATRTAGAPGSTAEAGGTGEACITGAPGADRIRRLLERGVAVRTVTDRRGTDFPDRAQELIALTGLGLQARIGQSLPTALVLVDRRTCLLPPLPGNDEAGDGAALVFGDRLLHRAALPLFESLWARATPLGSPDGPITADQRELLGLLASGLKDETIARRLGVHVHTVRRRITRMLEELDADTRFQAGVQAAIRGWLRPYPDPAAEHFTASGGPGPPAMANG
ncbi:helix-turn-helix transcriptional regulator [Streptomyces xanthophaeus]|uniref:helix-turn-helix transcriptional regulator n=1 Tax=Streptomyces xanthophaeus TaxID=67385 RepID=UPI00264801AF|nr:helix-turn-helix transcriptional regulator [Streptomyces xanthophaeus]WKD36667.1 helix-turn-helix transcriptional regulator [Streptomyces xanthophaeus]